MKPLSRLRDLEPRLEDQIDRLTQEISSLKRALAGKRRRDWARPSRDDIEDSLRALLDEYVPRAKRQLKRAGRVARDNPAPLIAGIVATALLAALLYRRS
jgi:hypothetical protein